MHALINDGRPFLHRDHETVGFRPSAFRSAVRDGLIRRVMERVYVDAFATDSPALRLAAMKLMAPAHVIVGDDSAAWLYGLDTRSPGERHLMTPTLLVPHGSSRLRVSGARCRQAIVPDADVVDLGGLRVTSPLRTASDLMRRKWRPFALAAGDTFAHAGLVDRHELSWYVRRLRGYPGIAQARQLVGLVEPLAASPGESWTRLRIVDAGLPRPTVQYAVVDASGMQRFIDMAYVEEMVGLEFDGRKFHTGSDDVAHDEDRRRLITAATGMRFVVARHEDVFGTDTAFEDEIGRLVGRRPLPRWW